MRSTLLVGKRIAILVAQGFEQVELTRPRRALEEAGAEALLVSPEARTVRAWNFSDWGETFSVDMLLANALGEEFAALLLPGGVMNPDHLRMNPAAVAFVRRFVESGQPIASICHGPWTLIEADGVRGRTMTSWPSLRTDLRNAGATWVDQEVVVDRRLVTSRRPDDIPRFNAAMVTEFAIGPDVPSAGVSAPRVSP